MSIKLLKTIFGNFTNRAPIEKVLADSRSGVLNKMGMASCRLALANKKLNAQYNSSVFPDWVATNLLGEQGNFETDLSFWGVTGNAEVSITRKYVGVKSVRFFPSAGAAIVEKNISAIDGNTLYVCAYGNRLSGTLTNVAIRLFDYGT